MPQITPDQLDDILETAEAFLDNGDDFNPPEDQDVPHDPRLRLLAELNGFLASQPSAGTHAYDMMASIEEINAENTRILIELIAGVVMMKRQENPLAEKMSVTFKPTDIDDMQRNYIFGVKRHGMQVTVTLTKKDEPSDSWMIDDNETGEGAKDQAAEAPERPVWCVRTGSGALVACTGQEDAEIEFEANHAQDALAAVENRFCLHETCPSTGCNKPEVTSTT